MKGKIKILEEIKPLGEAIFETTKELAVPGRGILNLAHKTVFDYESIKKHEDYIGGVVLPVEQFVKHSDEMSKHQLTTCKGVFVSLVNNDPKKTAADAIQSLEDKAPIIDFVYIPYQYDSKDESKPQNIAKLALYFQKQGKFVVISVVTPENKSPKDLQSALSELTYYISRENVFLDGLMIDVSLIEGSKSVHQNLIYLAIIRRSLPARLKLIAIKVTSKQDLDRIYQLTKENNVGSLEFAFSVEDLSLDFHSLAMATTGIYV